MKKAFTWLESEGLAYTFVDYAKQKPSLEDLQRWQAGFGELPVNKAGTTFRKFKEAYEAASAEEQAQLLIANPSALKRPILEGPGLLLKSFKAEEWAHHLIKS